MPAIRTKSVTETMDREHDGPRILVTRYTPQGVNGTRYHAWISNLAQSEPLVKAFQSEAIGWKEFSRRYREELYRSLIGDLVRNVPVAGLLPRGQ